VKSEEVPVAKKKVLVTGMAGQIGGILRRYLGNKYELSGLDSKPAEDFPLLVADISDFQAIRPAFQGQEVVVHLAADPRPDAPWESILKSNIIGTYNVFEAAREAGVRRVIFASTNHVVGFYPMKEDPYKAIYEGRLGEVRRPFPLLTTGMYRPDGYYGVSKAFGELLGSYYHDQFGLSVICLRIGWVMTPDDPTFSPAALSLWLSHRDCAQAIEKSIEARPSVGFTVVYAMSKNSLRIWDIETTQRILGYEPHDAASEEWK
jgi:NAD+ dependent glucose-6-phosphate dehydrogenase